MIVQLQTSYGERRLWLVQNSQKDTQAKLPYCFKGKFEKDIQVSPFTPSTSYIIRSSDPCSAPLSGLNIMIELLEKGKPNQDSDSRNDTEWKQESESNQNSESKQDSESNQNIGSKQNSVSDLEKKESKEKSKTIIYAVVNSTGSPLDAATADLGSSITFLMYWWWVPLCVVVSLRIYSRAIWIYFTHNEKELNVQTRAEPAITAIAKSARISER